MSGKHLSSLASLILGGSSTLLALPSFPVLDMSSELVKLLLACGFGPPPGLGLSCVQRKRFEEVVTWLSDAEIDCALDFCGLGSLADLPGSEVLDQTAQDLLQKIVEARRCRYCFLRAY